MAPPTDLQTLLRLAQEQTAAHARLQTQRMIADLISDNIDNPNALRQLVQNLREPARGSCEDTLTAGKIPQRIE